MKKLSLLGVIALLMMVLAVPVMAVTPSPVCSLSIIEKTPMPDNQPFVPVVDGDSGIMVYSGDGTSFTFTATGLQTNTQYTLISYKEPWNGAGSAVQGTGTSDGSGSITITGTTNFVDNLYTTGEYAGQTGAKIWLVPSADFSVDHFVSWNPTAWLFETRIIKSDEACGGSATAQITGSFTACNQVLGIATEFTKSTDFGAMIVGDNELNEVGNIKVTSQCTAWKVEEPASSVNTAGYMTDGAKTLTNELKQKDINAGNTFVPVLLSWSGFNGASNPALSVFSYPLSFQQTVTSGDVSGNYGITLTYTATAV